MAMIDYGALVIKNGIPLNKNKGMFMDSPEYFDEIIKDNYFAYCGDEEYSLCFYKCSITETKNGHAVGNLWKFPFASETFIRDNGVRITVKRLDKLVPVYVDPGCDTWEEYVRFSWVDATGNEKDNELHRGKYWHRIFRRMMKKRRMPAYYSQSFKYSATWEYKGDKWEVIFGYGIDPDEDVFNDCVTRGNYSYYEGSINYIKEKFFYEQESEKKMVEKT